MSYRNTEINEIRQETIAKNINKLRGNLSRKKFEEKYGIPEDSIYDWEKRGKMPQLSNLVDLCNKFNCDLDYLTGRIEAKTHDADFVMKHTGLSEEAVKALHDLKERSPAALAILDAFIRTIDDYENDALGTILLNRVSDLFRYRQGKQICEDSDNTAIKMETIETDIDGMTIEVDRYPDVLQDSDPYEKNVVLNECNEKIDLIRYHITQDATKVLDEMLAKYSEQRKLNGFGFEKTMIATPDYLNKIYDPETKKLRSAE